MPATTSFEEFRRSRNPVAAPAAPAVPAGFTGNLPLPQGQISADKLMPHEREQLMKIGWQPGTPIPGNLSEIVQHIVADAKNTTGLLPVSPDTKPLEVMVQDIATMTPEQQKRIQQIMVETTEAATRGPLVANASASVLQAAQFAESMGRGQPAPVAQPQPVGLTPGAIRQGPPRGQPVPQVDLIAHAQQQANAMRAQATSEPEPEPETAPADAEEPKNTGKCQHCGWDLSVPDERNPTDEDKYAYLVMLLSGRSDVRFNKAYSRFGGNLVAQFRSLSTDESELAMHQARADLMADQIQLQGEYFNRLQEYRMALSLEHIEVAGRGLTKVPAISLTQRDDDDNTLLVDLLAWLRAHALSSEHLWLTVQEDFFDFQKLCLKLQGLKDDSAFWTGIAVRP
jgi:hypothetical protein